MAQPREANFFYLLTGLLIALLAGPVFMELTDRPARFFASLAFSATLIVGIWSLAGSRTVFMVGIGLVALDISLTAIALLRSSPGFNMLSLLTALAFCLMSLVFALRHVLFGRRMNLNRMVGAICVYLLLGVSIGILNILIDYLIPGSFSGLPGASAGSYGSDLLYYSFVTMTTLGYGDITPEGPLARVLAYLAAIAGQFYIAILVGTLVGMYLGQRKHDDGPPPG